MPQRFNTKQSASDRREIRVFISSTFRDMQEEREELVKQIFPQLRRLCESRGVTWARWTCAGVCGWGAALRSSL
jgi:preprotein translocase subunit SecA/nephrocystin-3